MLTVSGHSQSSTFSKVGNRMTGLTSAIHFSKMLIQTAIIDQSHSQNKEKLTKKFCWRFNGVNFIMDVACAKKSEHCSVHFWGTGGSQKGRSLET